MASQRHRSATRNEHDRVGKEEGNPVRAKRAWVHQRRLHVVPKLPCAARRTPGRAAHHGPGGPRWATPPAGDLNHALVQLDESAIAGNVGRDLAFTASRLAARSHPAAGRCGRPCCAVVAGHVRHFALERVREIDRRVQQASGKAMQPMRTHPARSRAHLPRGQWPWTSRSHATACSRRAAPRGKQDGFVAGTRAPRSGLPRVSVRVLASMRTGSPDRRCSCTLCCTVPSRSSSATSTWSVSRPPGQATHATTSPQGTHYTRCTPRAPPRASRASNPPTPATTRPQRAALAGLPAEHTSRAAVTRMASLERSPYLGTGYDGEDAAGRQSARVRPARPEVDGAARADPRRPSPRPGCVCVGSGNRGQNLGLVLKKKKNGAMKIHKPGSRAENMRVSDARDPRDPREVQKIVRSNYAVITPL